MRSNSFKPEYKDVNCILMDGGLGDHIGSLIAVDYILKNYPWINLLIWVPDYLLDLSKNVLPDKAIVRNYTSMRKKYNHKKTTKTTKWDGITSPMKMSHVDYAFQKLCDEVVSIDKKNYLKVNLEKVGISHYKLPSKYVVLTTGYTASVREFHSDTVNQLITHVKSKGYTPVFLGQTNTKTGAAHIIQGIFKTEVNYSEGINLIDKTDLLEAAKVMQGAAVVVGVDCGLLHLAGCTDASIVAGYTTVSPELRMPIRNNELGFQVYPVVPYESLSCRFCQVKTNFLYGHDYRDCIYKDYECVKQLTADKFIKELGNILK